MTRFAYEIYLADGNIDAAQWQNLIKKLTEWCGLFGSWSIEARVQQSTIYYYLQCTRELPASVGMKEFLLKPVSLNVLSDVTARARQLYFLRHSDSLPAMIGELKARKLVFVAFKANFCTCGKICVCIMNLFYASKTECFYSGLPWRTPAQLLAVNFGKFSQYLYRSFPKYLKMGKTLRLLSANSDGAILQAETFPYDVSQQFLCLANYDFYKHSLILGASGSGKSKFIALLISKILAESSEQYKVVVIDPHDALKADFTEDENCRVTDFANLARSVDLFAGCAKDLNVSVELSLTIFEALMANNYNSYVDRVLRYTLFVLMKAKKFSLVTLRKLLTDVEYRHALLDACCEDLPESVVRFFLTEYNTLRTQHYDQAIAPIIAFVDELQMVPVFNADMPLATLLGCLQQASLNIFSLSRPRMGTKVVKMIAGLLLQQLFVIAENQLLSQHLIVVIDEVAVVENPILTRFLAELRKYHTSVILIGQYFRQFSAELRSAIYANVANYYIFKVSRDDAEDLTRNLNIKISKDDTASAKVELLSNLKLRECIAQLSVGETVYPAIKARTLDYISRQTDQKKPVHINFLEKPLTMPAVGPHYVAADFTGTFGCSGAENVKTVMRSVTTRRKRW